MRTNAELYEQDLYAWTQATAALLREGKWCDLDREALAEEVEGLGAGDHRELRRRLQRLVTHLLKWQYQPLKRQTGQSWRSTIRTQRQEIADLLEQSPSFESKKSEPSNLRQSDLGQCRCRLRGPAARA